MPNKSSIYCVLYRLCCSNCGSIYSGKSLQIQLKLCHLIIYCSLKKLLADFGMKLGYCDLWTTSYIHWKAAHSLNSFPNRHIICDACYEKSHCNHRICGFVFILCHFACLPAFPTTDFSEIYLCNGTYSRLTIPHWIRTVNMNLFKRALRMKFISNRIRLLAILILRTESLWRLRCVYVSSLKWIQIHSHFNRKCWCITALSNWISPWIWFIIEIFLR